MKVFTPLTLLMVVALAGIAQNEPPNPLLNTLDTNLDGVISAAEIRAAATSLLTLDRDRDGQLTADEIRPQFGGPSKEASDDLVATLMAFDKNGDGKLSKDELPERMQGMLERGDMDKDGFLTAVEIRRMWVAQPEPEPDRGRGGGPPRDPIFSAIDLDHDGVLSAEEIRRAPVSLLLLDRNGDGQLTPDEYRPVFGRGRGGRGMRQP